MFKVTHTNERQCFALLGRQAVGKEGVEKTSVEVMANQLTFLGGPGEKGAAKKEAPKPAETSPAGDAGNFIDDDGDLPF